MGLLFYCFALGPTLGYFFCCFVILIGFDLVFDLVAVFRDLLVDFLRFVYLLSWFVVWSHCSAVISASSGSCSLPDWFGSFEGAFGSLSASCFRVSRVFIIYSSAKAGSICICFASRSALTAFMNSTTPAYFCSTVSLSALDRWVLAFTPSCMCYPIWSS